MIQVRIDQTFGQIAVRQVPWTLRIETNPPKVGVEKRPADFKVSTKPIAVEIDLTNSRESIGYKALVPFQKEYAQKGMSNALSIIAAKAQEGDRLARVEDGGSPIAAMAAQAMNTQKEFNVGLMPTTPPDITARRGQMVAVKAKPGDVQVSLQSGPPVTKAQRGSIDISTKVKASIKMDVVGTWIDLKG